MSSQDLYIPPHGIYFRLLGYVSQNVIFSRTSQSPEVGQIAVQNEHNDQYFTLIHGTGSRKGTYAIKSKVTHNVLFSRESPSPKVGHIGGDGKYNDDWFEFEPGRGQYAKQFRLITPSEKVALVSRTNIKPYLYNHPEGDIHPDQHFSFLFEDMNIDRIEYDLKLGKILSNNPLVLANQTIYNDTDLDQEMSFQLNETTTHTSTFEYSTGFTVTVGAEFKSGVPVVAETTLKVETSTTNTWTWGEQNSFSKSYTATFPVKAGPRESVQAVSTVNRGDIEVPFTMYLSSKSTGTKAETKGIWRGVSTWDLRHTVSYV